MTDVCRFDFNAGHGLPQQQRSSAQTQWQLELLIAARDKSFAKLRWRKFFLDAAECGRRQTDLTAFK
jgi:hypothetical protein